MKKFGRLLLTGCICGCLFTSFGSVAFAAGNGSSLDTMLAGVAVTLEEYAESDQAVLQENKACHTEEFADMTGVAGAALLDIENTDAEPVKPNPYENVAISQVEAYVNVRETPSTDGEVLGKIYNNCAATILYSVDGEDGEWYYIESGSVKGYIKTDYFVTGEEAEAIAREVGHVTATTTATTLRLREEPNTDSTTLTLLAEGEKYEVVDEIDGFVKISLDGEMEGYVSSEFVEIQVDFEQAISIEEEQAKLAEEARKAREAEEAAERLRKAQEEAARQEELERQRQAQQSSSNSSSSSGSGSSGSGSSSSGSSSSGSGSSSSGSSSSGSGSSSSGSGSSSSGSGSSGSDGSESSETQAVYSATRDSIVSFASQYEGRMLYVYGGCSLSSGVDCSGFANQVFANCGISIPRDSRSQASGGRSVSLDSVQPGDLIFYKNSSGSINHVAIYIGGGQVIHASSSDVGIIVSDMYYRTPCCAASYIN